MLENKREIYLAADRRGTRVREMCCLRMRLDVHCAGKMWYNTVATIGLVGAHLVSTGVTGGVGSEPRSLTSLKWAQPITANNTPQYALAA